MGSQLIHFCWSEEEFSCLQLTVPYVASALVTMVVPVKLSIPAPMQFTMKMTTHFPLEILCMF